MKKNVLALLLLMVMVLVTACGNNTSGNGNTANSANDAEGGEAAAGDKLKVVLLIPGTLGDKSFFDAANNGLQKVKDELGAETKVVEMGTDKTKWEPTFNDIAAEDWDVVISGGSEITEMFNATAEANPDKNSSTMTRTSKKHLPICTTCPIPPMKYPSWLVRQQHWLRNPICRMRIRRTSSGL